MSYMRKCATVDNLWYDEKKEEGNYWEDYSGVETTV